ncbi:MAG: hypothetical protein AUI14_11175 [Actinobacteria bacterium 13_2_20CM_2_71_6]|nr:MAG: hypothetical protein AUI14_11175 [Actinobacteria bacterium 13_2_20CM_2_71_6]
MTAKVAPSIRRMVPVPRLTAYAVAACCTTSIGSPGSATCTCPATSAAEPSSSVTSPMRDDANQAAPDSNRGRAAGKPSPAPKTTSAATPATVTAVTSTMRSRPVRHSMEATLMTVATRVPGRTPLST